MKKVIYAIVTCGLVISQSISTAAIAAPALATQSDKLSYTIGYEFGKNLKVNGVDVNSHALQQGIMDAQQGKQPALTEEETQATLDIFKKQMLASQAKEMQIKSMQNKKAGTAFLAKNKQKSGVKTLANGVQYKVTTAGKGTKPKATDNVMVEYEGRFINGDVFDKSTRPVVFNLSEVIPGWAQVLQLMPVGSTWEVYIPPEQAYGERGVPRGPIGPNQTLIFTITLKSIAKNVARKP